jgi:hypothetical protein
MYILPHSRVLVIAGPLLFGALLFSCASAPSPVDNPSENARNVPVEESEYPPLPEIPGENGAVVKIAPPETAFSESLSALPPEKSAFEPPREDLYIMGSGKVDPAELGAFLLSGNAAADPLFVEELAVLYREEAAIEAVNHDIAFAQMCLETGFLRYGNLVTPEMNNFCGLGAMSTDYPGESFATPQIGVRAHIQHLKAYASKEGLNQELVDPRYQWVRYGSAPTIDDLTGAWAVDRDYGNKIRGILERLYLFTKTE